MGTAQTKANNKYKAKTYDRIEIIVPKGEKEKIRNHAESKGHSLNSFTCEAINEKMQRESGANEQ